MDIQVSSNFERALFEACDRDAEAVDRLMAALAQSRAFTVEPQALAAIRDDFVAGTTDEADSAATIAGTWRDTGFLPDPHTAVGLAVARRHMAPETPMVTLSTAHPAKFSAAVEAAIGQPPALPPGFDDLTSRKEEFVVLANDQSVVEDFLLSNANSVRDEV